MSHVQLDSRVQLDGEIRELELYEFLAAPKTQQAFMRTVHSVLSRWGFTDFGHVLTRSAEDSQKIWVFPDKSREPYVEGRLHTYDLSVKHSLISDKAIFQSQINEYVDRAPMENEEIAANREIRAMLESQGFLDHCALAFDSSQDSRAIFTFSIRGASPEYFQKLAHRHLNSVRTLAHAVNQIGAQKHRMKYLHGRGQGIINNKPLQLLDVLANDDLRTLEDAAEYLNISIGTANSHVRAIKAAFGVPTIARAVAEALHRGLIVKREKKI